MHFETFGTLSSSLQLSLCVGLYRSLKTPWHSSTHIPVAGHGIATARLAARRSGGDTGIFRSKSTVRVVLPGSDCVRVSLKEAP